MIAEESPREGEVLARYGCAEVIDVRLRDSEYAVRVVREDGQGHWVSEDVLTYGHAIVLMEALQEATAFIALERRRPGRGDGWPQGQRVGPEPLAPPPGRPVRGATDHQAGWFPLTASR